MDVKAFGYLVSSVSVLLLGIVAWPAPDEPGWLAPVLIAGMSLSIVGMAIRYTSHRKEKGAIRYALRKAEEAEKRSD